MNRPFKLFLLLFCLVQSVWTYGIPRPQVKTYRKGFEVYLAHEDGLEYVHFSAEHNLTGDTVWQPFSLSDDNKLWRYTSYDVQLKLGDVYRFMISARSEGISCYKIYIFHITKIYEETTENKAQPSALGELCQYIIPKTTFKTYSKGFEVTLPHESGIEFVQFTAEPQVVISYPNGGNGWHPFTLTEQNQLWTYNNFNVEPKVGDVFKFWISVRKEGVSYLKSSVFLNFKIYPEITTNEPDTSALGEMPPYIIPKPKVKAYRTGLEISIPHEYGIEYVAFSAVINSELENQSWNIVFAPDLNGQWTHKISDTEIHVGDTVNYFVFVQKNGQYYSNENLVYTVESYEEDNTWYISS